MQTITKDDLYQLNKWDAFVITMLLQLYFIQYSLV